MVASHYPEQHFRIRHALAGNRCFDLDQILATALTFPPDLVHCQMADRSPGEGLGSSRSPKMSTEHVIRRLNECNAWLEIKHAQLAPIYRDLTVRCFEEIKRAAAPHARGVKDLIAYLVFSSPNAITPYHIDNEYNFLLHISGVKTVHIWPGRVEGPITQADLERYYKRGFHDVPYRQELEHTAQVHELRPGDGLFIPVHTPHWVMNGPEVCVSLAVTYHTDALQREGRIHWLNGHLRQWGFSPKPPAASRLSDGAKDLVARAAQRAVRHRLRPLR